MDCTRINVVWGVLGVLLDRTKIASCCVRSGFPNGTNGIPISFKVLPMVPLVIPFVPMVMPMAPLVTNGTIGKLPMVPLGEPRTEPLLFVIVCACPYSSNIALSPIMAMTLYYPVQDKTTTRPVYTQNYYTKKNKQKKNKLFVSI